MKKKPAAQHGLREIAPVRQVRGQPRRRWFSSSRCDLIVWLGEGGAPAGFQLCYDKGGDEHALTWNASEGFRHAAVDSGEREPLKYKGSPVLVPDGVPDAKRVGEIFRIESAGLPEEITRFVLDKLAAPMKGKAP